MIIERELIEKAAVENVLLMTSMSVLGISSLLNAAALVLTYHRSGYKSLSKRRAAVLFSLGHAFVAACGILAIISAFEVRSGMHYVYSTLAWSILAVISLSVSILFIMPANIWGDYKRE